MSEEFERYERQYGEISASLSRQCTAAAALDGELKKQKISEIKSGIEDAEKLIKKMDSETRSLQRSMRSSLHTKIKEYKSDLKSLKSEVKRVASARSSMASARSSKAREELLESGMGDTLAKVSAEQRERLIRSTGRLNQSSERINESNRIMTETEELGVATMQDMVQQRQSLLHANNTLNLVDDDIGESQKILSIMSRQMDRNKWTVGCIAVAVVIAIILFLCFKLVASQT